MNFKDIVAAIPLLGSLISGIGKLIPKKGAPQREQPMGELKSEIAKREAEERVRKQLEEMNGRKPEGQP